MNCTKCNDVIRNNTYPECVNCSLSCSVCGQPAVFIDELAFCKDYCEVYKAKNGFKDDLIPFNENEE